MSLKFNIDRPKISDDEIKKGQNFKELVDRFKQQSLKQAQGDESWWKNKKVRYSTVIAGITVVCTITYASLFKSQKQQAKTNETLITQQTKTENGEPAKAKAFVAAPSQKLKVPYTAYKINNTKGGSITHVTSSKIKVPKNSFVDKNGKDIIGDVTIEYREFHDLGDIVVSGIPMAYDSAGHKFNLESAGMFDIRGSQNGEPVFIKPEKQLQVELASATAENKFNQYYLDTVEQNWKYLKRDHATALSSSVEKKNKAANFNNEEFSTPKLKSLKNDIERVLPKKIDSVKVVYTARAEKLPKAKEPAKPVKSTPGRPTFNLEGSDDEFPELAAFNGVLFEVGPENKNYSKDLHEITWSDVKVSQGPVKGKNYILNLSYRNRSEKLIVYPVLSGDNFEKAQKAYEQKLEAYQSLIEKRQAEEKRLLAEMAAKQAAYVAEQKKKQEEYDKEKARILASYNQAEQNEIASNFNAMSTPVKASRIFAVSRFGIFNSDCPQPVPEGKSISPIFVTEGKEKPVFPDFIYLIDHRKRTVYTIDRQQGLKISYEPGSVYSICVFQKNKMYLCSKEAFGKTLEDNSNKFLVTPLPDAADNPADFKKALEI